MELKKEYLVGIIIILLLVLFYMYYNKNNENFSVIDENPKKYNKQSKSYYISKELNVDKNCDVDMPLPHNIDQNQNVTFNNNDNSSQDYILQELPYAETNSTDEKIIVKNKIHPFPQQMAHFLKKFSSAENAEKNIVTSQDNLNSEQHNNEIQDNNEENPQIVIKVEKSNYNLSIVLLLTVILIWFIYYTR